tara:strand:+ start:2496 stop:2651 length:156 start_codon:yes stop_codon:yes gene_type:complete
MRKKVHDYLAKPTKAAFAELTTMEQAYVQRIEAGEEKKPVAAAKKAPAKEK